MERAQLTPRLVAARAPVSGSCAPAGAAVFHMGEPVRIGLAADDPRHGTAGAYTNHRCRCAVCRAAWSKYQRERPGPPCCVCGTPSPGGHRRRYRLKIGQNKRVFCSTECFGFGRERKWADKREGQRESARRRRAALRAQGLTCLGTPYVSDTMREAHAERFTPPTERRPWTLVEMAKASR